MAQGDRARRLAAWGSSMVDAGGDIACAGMPPDEPWVVTVADPLDDAQDLAVLSLDHEAIATSSRVKRRWVHEGKPAHHLIDPRTGAPAQTNVLSVTVVADKSYWFISRSSGLVAYGLITLGVLWGLVQSGSLFRSRVSPLLAFGMHSFLSWLGLGFAVLHGIILLGDGYINIDLPRIFTPFLAEYRPIPVGLGIIGFHLMLLLTLSFYARSYLGQTSFRLLHYGSFLVFILVTLHSLYAGTDTGSLWWVYLLSLIAVRAQRRGLRSRRGGRR